MSAEIDREAMWANSDAIGKMTDVALELYPNSKLAKSVAQIAAGTCGSMLAESGIVVDVGITHCTTNTDLTMVSHSCSILTDSIKIICQQVVKQILSEQYGVINDSIAVRTVAREEVKSEMYTHNTTEHCEPQIPTCGVEALRYQVSNFSLFNKETVQ